MSSAQKLSMYKGEKRHWDNGLKASLTFDCFKPYLDKEGKVDRRAAERGLGYTWATIFKYMKDISIETSMMYVEQRAEDQIIRLEKEQLSLYKLKNGKVSIGRAMVGLGHSFPVIKRECIRHDLPTFHQRISQTLCLSAVSEALGGLSWKEEWKSYRFKSPFTGYRFRFDGFFPDINLIVEFHGHQHWMFPNAFMSEKHEDRYLRGREYDRIKKRMIEESPDLTYFCLREDEPFQSPDYIRGRLYQAGILSIDQVCVDGYPDQDPDDFE